MKRKLPKNQKNKTFIPRTVVRALKMTLVPHKENEYRPHLIRRYGLVAIIFVVFGLFVGPHMIKNGQVLGHKSNITVSSLLEETGEVRVKEGLKPLTRSSKLTQAAYLKAQDMLAKQYWAHVSPNGDQPWKWLGDVKYSYDQAGENLAKNFNTTEELMQAWMDSPSHRANILKPEYTEAGFAVAYGEMDGEPISLVVAFYAVPTEVEGVATATKFSSSSIDKAGITAKLAALSRSINMMMATGLILITLAIVVSLITHFHRHKLPKKLRHSWYRHHAIYKSLGLVIFGVFMILIVGSRGQI